METTANLSLPYIMPSQAQKHVTHNEALRALDALVQLAVLDRNLSAPPPAPADGDRYIAAADASGAWAGRAGCIAAWQDGGWAFFEPKSGWICFVIDEQTLIYWTGTTWESAAAVLADFQNLPLLGLGTAADSENRFAAKLNKALWTALSNAEGGSGDLRYTLNKHGPNNVLSLLMQSGWSGRAEIGLVGNDNLSIRVSADGSAWHDALTVDRNSGKVALPGSNFLTDFAVSLLPDSGRFAGNAANGISVGAFVFPDYLMTHNGSTAAQGGKFITDNSDYGGSAGFLDPNIKALVDTIRAPGWRRYGVEFHAAMITMGPGTNGEITANGIPHYFSSFLAFGPRAPHMTFHAYLRALDAPIAYSCLPGQTILKNGVAGTNMISIAPAEGWVSITVRDEQDPRSSFGYDQTPFNIYAAQAGDRYLVACPALMGGLTHVDDNVGIISGLNRWLP